MDISSSNIDFQVCIQCMTFNHASYIDDAMNGICMQETDFPFVAVIMDDASTDGEPEVIKQYLQEHFDLENKSIVCKEETNDYIMTFARHKTNINCYFAVFYLKYNHFRKKSKEPYFKEIMDSSKYVALCEGDDYWTSSFKLQKQVDFLNTHPEYSMCFHSTKIQNDTENKPATHCDHILEKDYTADEIMTDWIVSTNSMVFRKEIFGYKMIGVERILNGDTTVKLRCASSGKIRGFSDTMSVYRINDGGITQDPTKQKDRIKRFPGHYIFLRENFPVVSRELINNYLGRSYYWRVRSVDKVYQPIFWCDLFRAFYYNPNYVFTELGMYIKKIL